MKKLFGSKGEEVPAQSVSGFGHYPALRKQGTKIYFQRRSLFSITPGLIFLPLVLPTRKHRPLI